MMVAFVSAKKYEDLIRNEGARVLSQIPEVSSPLLVAGSGHISSSSEILWLPLLLPKMTKIR